MSRQIRVPGEISSIFLSALVLTVLLFTSSAFCAGVYVGYSIRPEHLEAMFQGHIDTILEGKLEQYLSDK